MASFLVAKRPDYHKKRENTNNPGCNYGDQTPVKTLFNCERCCCRCISLNDFFLNRCGLVTILGGSDIIESIEFQFGIILPMEIGDAENIAIDRNTGIRNNFLIVILNKKCEICVFKCHLERIILIGF